jgi:hypothetical protein
MFTTFLIINSIFTAFIALQQDIFGTSSSASDAASSIPITILTFLIIYYFALRFRRKFFIVHEFSNDNVKLPEVVNKVGNEMTIKYASSFTKGNQIYLTTSRIIFHCQSLLRGKFFTRYFETKSVRNIEVIYKNPYGWLIIAGLNVLFGIIFASSSASKSSSNSNYFFKESSSSGGAGSAFLIIFLTLIQSGFFVLLWYYMKGFYLVFNNGTISGLFCRSKEGLEDILKRFDILRFTNRTITIPGTKNDVQESKDVICLSCKSVISLEAEDLKSNTFVCPICSTVNAIK